MITRRTALLGVLAAPALAQPFAGGRPVRLVVPFPPGGAVDLLGRLLAEQLRPALGTDVVVDNRGGAGGNLGMEAVARAAPDGTTLGIGSTATLIANRFLYSRLPFDPTRDFTLISRVTNGTVLCVVNADTARQRGWTDFRALLAWARANPGRISMGSSGVGTTSHFMIEMVKQRAGVDIVHVPYRGGGPAISDLVAGTIDMMFDVMPALMPHVEAGRFRALAVGSAQRLSILPDVPAMGDFRDLGLGEVDMQTWNAIVGPAGMEAALVQRLSETLRQVMALPAVTGRLGPLGYEAVTDAAPADFVRLVADETPRWEQIVRLSGARVE
jgi:tripartite-type tricarboxylate transporter receptor subunit TctC